MFRALAALGVSPEHADQIVSQPEGSAIAAARTWVSESSAPHGSEERFENGWFAGGRAVSSDLLRIAGSTLTADQAEIAQLLEIAADCATDTVTYTSAR